MTFPREAIWHLDALIRADYNRLADSYLFWLLVCTGIVVLGIALEGPEVVYDMRELLRGPFRPGTVGAAEHAAPPKREKPTWIASLALVGWLLVVAGVAGEGASEGFLYKAEGLLSTFNAITLQAEQTETAQAEERANEASLRAAEARKEAAKAELQLAKLRAPRSLTEAQQRQLVSELKPFAGTQILIAYNGGDVEAGRLESQLWVVLREAGWNVDQDLTGRAGMPFQTAESTTGITVSRISGEKLSTGATVQPVFAEAADALAKALQKLGLLNTGPGGIHLVTDNPNQEVVVVVGRKL